MPTNSPIQERIGNLGAIGVAVETVFGTPVAATQFSDAMSTSLKPDPGLFYPSQMIGVRDSSVFPLYGQQKLQGSIDGMLVPTNAIDLLIYGIGGDAGNPLTSGPTSLLGLTGTSVGGGWATTIAGAGTLAAGATTFNVTSATGIANNQFVQFGTTNTPAGNVPEVRKIINITGVAVTLDTATSFDHTIGVSGVAITQVQAPFLHNVIQQNYLKSLTVEKNIGGFQSERYAGTKVGKIALKAPATNNPVTMTSDVMAKGWTIMNTPTSIVQVTPDAPFVFSEASLTLNSTTIYETYNLNVNIDNKMGETWTNAAAPQFITAQGLVVTGSFDAVFGSLNDATIGFLNQTMIGAATAPLTLTLQHPAGNSITLTMPTVQFNTDDVQIKPDTIVTETINFTATYSPSSPKTISAVVANGAWLAY